MFVVVASKTTSDLEVTCDVVVMTSSEEEAHEKAFRYQLAVTIDRVWTNVDFVNDPDWSAEFFRKVRRIGIDERLIEVVLNPEPFPRYGGKEDLVLIQSIYKELVKISYASERVQVHVLQK